MRGTSTLAEGSVVRRLSTRQRASVWSRHPRIVLLEDDADADPYVVGMTWARSLRVVLPRESYHLSYAADQDSLKLDRHRRCTTKPPYPLGLCLYSRPLPSGWVQGCDDSVCIAMFTFPQGMPPFPRDFSPLLFDARLFKCHYGLSPLSLCCCKLQFFKLSHRSPRYLLLTRYFWYTCEIFHLIFLWVLG